MILNGQRIPLRNKAPLTNHQKRKVQFTLMVAIYLLCDIDIDEMATGEITKHALAVQDKTQESTNRAQKALQETLEVC